MYNWTLNLWQLFYKKYYIVFHIFQTSKKIIWFLLILYLPKLPPNNGDSSDSGKKLKPGEISVIVVGVAVAVAIIAIVAFFLIRKNRIKLPDDDGIEALDGSSVSTRNDNPIYNKEAEDDPFKGDF